MNIWERYIAKKLIATFSFFFLCFFVIFAIVDLSAHGIRFLAKSSFWSVGVFYLNLLSTFLDLFLTLAFLLATIRVLFDLNKHQELVALQMAGISKKRIAAPFFVFAFFLACMCYMNTEWFSPSAQEFSNSFKTAHKSKKTRPKDLRIFTASLKDGSELVYRKFDPEKKELIDVFWIRSPDDIWHMKTLAVPDSEGRYADHFIRNEDRRLEKRESASARSFADLDLKGEAGSYRFIPYERRTLSHLFRALWTDSTEKRVLLSHLLYKLAAPLLPFIVVLALAPAAMRYVRNPRVFLITASSIFGFITLKIVLDGMLILGENQVLPSYAAILSPLVLAAGLSFPHFARMR